MKGTNTSTKKQRSEPILILLFLMGSLWMAFGEDQEAAALSGEPVRPLSPISPLSTKEQKLLSLETEIGAGWATLVHRETDFRKRREAIGAFHRLNAEVISEAERLRREVILEKQRQQTSVDRIEETLTPKERKLKEMEDELMEGWETVVHGETDFRRRRQAITEFHRLNADFIADTEKLQIEVRQEEKARRQAAAMALAPDSPSSPSSPDDPGDPGDFSDSEPRSAKEQELEQLQNRLLSDFEMIVQGESDMRKRREWLIEFHRLTRGDEARVEALRQELIAEKLQKKK